MELVRFTNSGTEANLMALALALHHTGRTEILAFRGGYHGGVIAFGSGEPSPVTVPHAWVMGDFDAVESTRALIREHELAAILVEPMQGSGGCLPASRAFLQMLREEATRTGALLIFDEVMTSRLGPRDEPGFAGVVPDLMTVGKYLAGGMSFGAFGGRRELMAAYDPTRPGALFHAGTFNNNVLSMSAGIAGLTQVLTDAALTDLNARGDRLRARLNEIVPTTGLGSLMTMHPSSEAEKQRLFFELLGAGYWIASRGMIALSLAITDEQCDGFAGRDGRRDPVLSRTLPTQVAHHIRERILSGELAPGDRIIETELAEEFEVSRHTLRSALQTLTHEGLLEQSQFKSTHVARPTARDVFETYTLRNTLEAMACRLAAERAPPGRGRRRRRGGRPHAGRPQPTRRR